MKRKVTKLNAEARERLAAIELYQAGNSQRETAKKFGVHFTTIGEWLRMYEQGGVAGLKVPLRPRPVHHLDAAELRALSGYADKYAPRIAALIALAETGKLSETAAAHGVTPQGLAKWRRDYLAGKWPPTISI